MPDIPTCIQEIITMIPAPATLMPKTATHPRHLVRSNRIDKTAPYIAPDTKDTVMKMGATLWTFLEGVESVHAHFARRTF